MSSPHFSQISKAAEAAERCERLAKELGRDEEQTIFAIMEELGIFPHDPVRFFMRVTTEYLELLRRYYPGLFGDDSHFGVGLLIHGDYDIRVGADWTGWYGNNQFLDPSIFG